MVQVVLVDDHALVRQGLRSLLNTYADVWVVGEAGDGAEAVSLVGKLRPQVVVMDINMPTMTGIEATMHIKTRWPQTTIIGISVNPDENNDTAMKQAGATMLLTKESVVDHLYDAIKNAVEKRR